ncbi:MAG: hypothetical protein JPMHGGIA_01939 [Saprospiraceae bacterium]|nr:hypothetical protein [Saprospiraceae bacterium]
MIGFILQIYRSHPIFSSSMQGRLFSFFLLLIPCLTDTAGNPPELGDVQWRRDLAEARRLSQQEGKPIFLLFQEVPGCGTCRQFGHRVLRHPLVVEAIETLFVPLCIYNNAKGQDRQVLEQFGEPAWNNPVVRIINADLSELCGRLSGDYSLYGVVSKMAAALLRGGQPLPPYLSLLEEELRAHRTGHQLVIFVTPCFWSGEKFFGRLPGVVHTESGFMYGREVVRVGYDPLQTNLASLAEAGKSAGVALEVYSAALSLKMAGMPHRSPGPFRKDGDTKYYLLNSGYRFVSMTPLQACRVNSAIGNGEDPQTFLSPRQLHAYRQFLSSGQRTSKKQLLSDPLPVTD